MMKKANPVSWRGSAWLAMLAVVLLTACGQPQDTGPATPKTAQDWFAIKVGEVAIDMQLAVRAAEMQQGLMGRRDLGDRQGMIFVYRAPEQMSFWMRNTPTPLDIGFFTSDGVLREVYPMHPYDETPVRSFRSDLQYALELKQGEFAKLGLKLGDRLDLAALRAALKERGFNPLLFAGLEE